MAPVHPCCGRRSAVFDELAPVCDASGCERALADEPALVFREEAGERRAYECACGAITVTVAKTHA